MYYTYVLLSMKDEKFYTGFTKDLKLRFEEHRRGEVESTKNRRPLELVYYEACLSQEDATRREKYLKTYHACPVQCRTYFTGGKMYLRNRLKFYLTG